MMTATKTAESVIQNLIVGLRAIPAGFTQIGCYSADPKTRAAHYAKMIQWGREFADTLESLPTAEALLEVSRYDNTLVNLDPQSWYLGQWRYDVAEVTR